MDNTMTYEMVQKFQEIDARLDALEAGKKLGDEPEEDEEEI